MRWIAASAFGSLSACGAQSIVDHLAGVRVGLALSLSVQIASIVKSTLSRRYAVIIFGAVLVCTTAAFAQSNSNGLLSGGELMVMGDSIEPNKPSDCAIRFAEFVRDLDSILASAPKAIDPIYAAFQRSFPIKKCNIEEILTIARTSRFFVGSDETVAFYNIGFNSAGVGSGNGFAVLISLNKKTGNMEKPFAKVNGF